MFIADILASVIAFGLLHLRGVRGYAGWRWLFLIEVCNMIKAMRSCQLIVEGLNHWYGRHCIICDAAARSDPDS